MSDCVFCRIVAGAILSQRVYEDDRVLAIRDINPQAPVHVLILPKEHVASVLAVDAGPDLIGALVRTAARVARQERISESGFRLLTNTGPDGGQAVPHLHFHLLGGRRMAWPPG